MSAAMRVLTAAMDFRRSWRTAAQGRTEVVVLRCSDASRLFRCEGAAGRGAGVGRCRLAIGLRRVPAPGGSAAGCQHALRAARNAPALRVLPLGEGPPRAYVSCEHAAHTRIGASIAAVSGRRARMSSSSSAWPGAAAGGSAIYGHAMAMGNPS